MAESLRDLVVSLSLNSDNFTRNIAMVNRQIREAESAFRLAGAGITNFESTSAGASAYVSNLQQRIGLQRNVVDQYSRALEQANSKLTTAYTRQEDYGNRLEQAREKQRALAQQEEPARRHTIPSRRKTACLEESDRREECFGQSYSKTQIIQTGRLGRVAVGTADPLREGHHCAV